jgi:hypothetical protein
MMLGQLLRGVNEKFGVGAVVLIDEYDAPAAMHISNQELAWDNCGVLHDFYMTLKKHIRHIRFAFVTGVTRFAATALDIGGNNFLDISLRSDYAGICGFPVSELESLFADRFDETLDRLKSEGQIEQGADGGALKAKILEWYGGYDWLGPEKVLNPYSVLNFFNESKFRAYWPYSRQPSYLTELVGERPFKYVQPSLDSCSGYSIRTFSLGRHSVVPLLYHSGYLAIDKEVLKDSGEKDDEGEPILVEAFTFRNPNVEVGAHYKRSLLERAFGLKDGYIARFAVDLRSSLLQKDSGKMAESLGDLLSGIVNIRFRQDESHYRSVFQAVFVAAGLEARGEPCGFWSDADIPFYIDGKVRVVFEVKHVDVNAEGDKGGDDDEGRAARELVSALEHAENAIRDKNSVGSFSFSASETICLALAVRGRDEVAARFMTPDRADDLPSS